MAGSGSDNGSVSWLEVVLEEYKTLRAEITTAMQTQQSSLSFAAATVGILAAGGFNAWEHDLPAVTVFIAGIPTLSGLGLIVWLGELARMQRAGAFLQELEAKVNGYFATRGEQEALSWETFLKGETQKQESKKHYWNYRTVVATFAFIALGSLSVGIAKGFDTELARGLIWTLVGVEGMVLLLLGVFVWRRRSLLGVRISGDSRTTKTSRG